MIFRRKVEKLENLLLLARYGKMAKALSVRLAIVFDQSERAEFNFSPRSVTPPQRYNTRWYILIKEKFLP